MQDVSTVIIEPNCDAIITSYGDIMITVNNLNTLSINEDVLDPIQLSIFSHRFMGIAGNYHLHIINILINLMVL